MIRDSILPAFSATAFLDAVKIILAPTVDARHDRRGADIRRRPHLACPRACARHQRRMGSSGAVVTRPFHRWRRCGAGAPASGVAGSPLPRWRLLHTTPTRPPTAPAGRVTARVSSPPQPSARSRSCVARHCCPKSAFACCCRGGTRVCVVAAAPLPTATPSLRPTPVAPVVGTAAPVSPPTPPPRGLRPHLGHRAAR